VRCDKFRYAVRGRIQCVVSLVWCGVMCLDMLCEVVYNVLDCWCGVV
jgi:hypothetical protein